MQIDSANEMLNEGSLDNKLFEPLRLRSPAIASIPEDLKYYSNYFNINTSQGTMPGPGTHKFLNKTEQETSNPNFKEFSYYINELGYRDVYPATTEKDVFAFFGCSMTLGEGLATEDNFPHIVSKHFNKKHLNFGQSGIGAYRIALMFAAASNVWNIETAVITLPNWARFHYVDSKSNIKSIHLPYQVDDKECNAVRLDMLKSFSDEYMISSTKDAINFILMIAKLKNINVILSSWDPGVSRIIEHITGYDVPRFNLWNPFIKERVDGDLARDNMHPGVNLVNVYVDKLTTAIKNNHYVKI